MLRAISKIMSSALRDRRKASHPLAAEDVVAAYEGLLGREPENNRAVEWHLSAARDRRALFVNIMRGDEFQSTNRDVSGIPTGRFLDQPAQPIEVDVDHSLLKRLLDRTGDTWRELGRKEAHWSVLTDPSYLTTSLDGKALDEFYASGHFELKVLLASLQRSGIAPDSIKNCLDFGCGVGRLSLALASQFEKVRGVDISDFHLAHARGAAKSRSASNVAFSQVESFEALSALPPCDLFVSLIVLQHNPPPVGLHLLRTLLSRVVRGGIAYFQVPTFIDGYAFNADEYLSRPPSRDMEMHPIPQIAIHRVLEDCGYRLLEVREDTRADMVNIVSQVFLAQRGPRPNEPR